MQYCNKSLIKNNNEILQYFNKNNDIALVMHQHALLDMSEYECMYNVWVGKMFSFLQGKRHESGTNIVYFFPRRLEVLAF